MIASTQTDISFNCKTTSAEISSLRKGQILLYGDRVGERAFVQVTAINQQSGRIFVTPLLLEGQSVVPPYIGQDSIAAPLIEGAAPSHKDHLALVASLKEMQEKRLNAHQATAQEWRETVFPKLLRRIPLLSAT